MQSVKLPPSPLDVLAPANCICGYGECCVCPDTEKALRAVAHSGAALNAEQREWCLREIGRVEGYDRKEHESATDRDLAHTVICAWTDYARDKGLL